MNAPHAVLPDDYAERVYAGVIGKCIGVYLGRPFEGWTYERITATMGEVLYYVNDRTDLPLKNHTLVVTDDDLSGTFTFLRALPDHGNNLCLTPQQIGQTWLNYIVERRAILWWGGMGNSTEHTAYLRLKSGINAPESGSTALNGRIVAEQIGAQIFVDGWAMVAPGDPELAADLAQRAARVSHDGEAIHAARVVAALEAGAFAEQDLGALLDTAVSLIPRESEIYRLIDDIRSWRATESDWREARERIAESYGYHRYGGVCHVIPNHAVIMLGLLYGDDDFQRSLMITNTSGWDTDCNSGNVGCILGIKNGLAAIDSGPDWRGPLADRLYLPTADGGRAITDAATEATRVANIGRALAGVPALLPKDGARFHFELPGSVQGFQPDTAADSRGTVSLENTQGNSESGARSLAIRFRHLAPGRAARIAAPTFIPPEAIGMRDYVLLASPTLYPGQVVRARVSADGANLAGVACRLFIRIYGSGDCLVTVYGPRKTLEPDSAHEFAWRVGDTGSQPIAQIGLETTSAHATAGVLYLDYLTWDGAPDITLTRPEAGGEMWRRAWVNAVDRFDPVWPESYRLVQNLGSGMLIQGTREWTDYEVKADIAADLAVSAGIAARVQGLRRYYALLMDARGTARLVRELDGTTVLVERGFPWEFGRVYELSLSVSGERLKASIDGELTFEAEDSGRPLDGGAVALVCKEGCVSCEAVRVRPCG